MLKLKLCKEVCTYCKILVITVLPTCWIGRTGTFLSVHVPMQNAHEQIKLNCGSNGRKTLLFRSDLLEPFYYSDLLDGTFQQFSDTAEQN